MARLWCVVLACVAGCGVRTPARIDVERLLAAEGPVEARRTLEIRVTGDARDVAGRLALAELDERIGRPSEAIEALEQVVALGGPVGARWRDEDRARLARLIAARGRARLVRGAATAGADFERARELGAAIDEGELGGSKAAGAIVALRHSDAEVREDGRRKLVAVVQAVSTAGGANGSVTVPAWRGARAGAVPDERARFGVWLWEQGAKRAAWEELSAWHAATRSPREPGLQQAYLTAARWWVPLDAIVRGGGRAGVTDDDLVGPMRCGFGVCAPHEVVGDEAAERAYEMAPVRGLEREPAEVAAIVAIELRAALRGEGSWGRRVAARVDVAAFAEPNELAHLAANVRPLIARLVGQDATEDDRLLTAAAEIVGDGPSARALRTVGEPGVPFRGNAVAEAAARHASVAVAGRDGTPSSVVIDRLRAIVIAYLRDPAIADRLGRDAVASAADAAAMQATLGALFDGLGDPARARAAWQAAVDASPEPGFLRGLAMAQARQGDADAALVSATVAAAASGDPAVVWTAVARELEGAGKGVHALEAARSAIDLAGPETLPVALEVAIAASHALGRDAQAAALAARRARVVGRDDGREGDPTDGRAALEAYRAQRGGETARPVPIARLWVASRWNRRDVALRAALSAALSPEDPRRAVIAGELVELAGDADPELGAAAVAALR